MRLLRHVLEYPDQIIPRFIGAAVAHSLCIGAEQGAALPVVEFKPPINAAYAYFLPLALQRHIPRRIFLLQYWGAGVYSVAMP